MNNPNKKRLRRTMMFLNAQKPGLIKDSYIYKPDSIMLDLEDAVAENQKDAARFSLYHALKTINYRGCERVVRINGLDSPYWKEDIRCSVAGGCDSIRIPKTESAQDVKLVEREIAYAEKEFGRPEGSVLIMAAVESARGVMKALDICESSERLFGIALSGGDYTKDLQTHITGTGIELMGARQNLVIAARAAGVQCFDTVYTDLDNMEGFRQDVETIHLMGFDRKSIINHLVIIHPAGIIQVCISSDPLSSKQLIDQMISVFICLTDLGDNIIRHGNLLRIQRCLYSNLITTGKRCKEKVGFTNGIK